MYKNSSYLHHPTDNSVRNKTPKLFCILVSATNQFSCDLSAVIMIFKLRLDLDCYQRLLLALVSSLCLASLLSLLGLSLTSWLAILAPGAASLAVLQSSLQLEVGDKSVLVTGCDTGFGLALAKHLRG